MNGRARQRPLPPWHPFPFGELLVLVGVVCAGAALATLGSERALWFGAAALTAALSAGLEIAVREHVTGYHDNSLVLAGALTCVAWGVGAWLRVGPFLLLVGGVVLFALAAVLLRLFYRRRRP